ncbi:MAG: acyltransferase [Armatimonadetes bacterium]|nr:acyltransferase [Akkermansiaceae bacterium]
MKDSPRTGEPIECLDGLRGVAIILVVIHHCFYFPPTVPYSEALTGLLQGGRLGVAIFFVLSGFLMGLVIFRDRESFNLRNYAIRRFARIYPPFFLSLLVAAIVALTLGQSIGGVIQSVMLHLSSLANWIDPKVQLNEVYWSLLIEIHFYILLPLVHQLYKATTGNPAVWTVLTFGIPPLAYRVATHYSEHILGQGWVGFDLATPKRMDSFFFGLLFAWLYLSGFGNRLSTNQLGKICGLGASLIIVSLLAYGITFVSPLLVSANSPAFFLELGYMGCQLGTFALLFMTFNRTGFWARLLSNGWLKFCGLVSYEWYLFHFLTARIFRKLLPSGSVPIYFVKMLVPIIGSLIVSALVYRYFSQPIQNRLRRNITRVTL